MYDNLKAREEIKQKTADSVPGIIIDEKDAFYFLPNPQPRVIQNTNMVVMYKSYADGTLIKDENGGASTKFQTRAEFIRKHPTIKLLKK
jgi:hypothetical protein